MNAFEWIVERQLEEAEAKGVFRNLPGAGKPIPDDDDHRVPADLRGAYRVMKTAGYLPEELLLRKESVRIEDLIAACHDDRERAALRSQLSENQLRYELLMERRGRTAASGAYAGPIARRLSGS